ncbi:KinB-signaling pathway activation protein [Melghirimyces algeriensis]|uniref:KinB signaling pathway activation protein n=1 Tax=Melghirimyces algeriensis TaxID=910412 RepID=A0A521E645_9BACL|nr:KinB-signaling pathway activation protein [Melghirimyces algeriensis]SMO79413.1 KinB signaling pathway activation protein [Melghirimyces algeriensis]
MTIRRMFFLFWTTLVLGTVTAPLVGFLVGGIVGSVGLDMISQLWAGIMYGAVAQMGFFCYLIFNMVAKGFIRNPYVYQAIQLFLTLAILWRTFGVSSGKSGFNGLGPWILPATILVVGLIVAWFKVKATHSMAFIPALFFMVSTTVLEAIPSLDQESLPIIMQMVLTLLVCNTWQVMQLHRLVAPISEKSKQRSQTSKPGS